MHRRALKFSIIALGALTAPCAWSQIAFEDITASSGIDDVGGSFGVAWGDSNADGYPDLWLSNHSRDDHFYVNSGNGQFALVTSPRLPAVNVDTHGIAWMDIDGDDDDDVFIQTGGPGVNDGENFLFVNYGSTPFPFLDRATLRGIANAGARGRTPHFLDVDLDSDLDLVLNGYFGNGLYPAIFLQQPDGTFVDGTVQTGYNPVNSEFSTLVRIDNEELYILAHAATYPAAAYNAATLPFVDEVVELFPDESSSVKDVAVADFDGDLLPELFLARGRDKSDAWQTSDTELDLSVLESEPVTVRFVTPGILSIDISPKDHLGGQARWELEEIYIGADGIHPDELPVQLDSTQVGIYPLEPGVDGILIGYDDFAGEWEVRIVNAVPTPAEIEIDSSADITAVTVVGFEPFVSDRQQVLLKKSGPSFVDVSESAGVPGDKNCFSVVAADFDNDMDVDVYLACGLPSGFAPNLLLENDGTGVFTAVTGSGGATGTVQGRSDVVTTADMNNDGFLDLLVTQGRGYTWGAFNQGPAQVFRNLGNENSWLSIDLQGTESNREGIGALLFLTTPDGKTQRRETDGGMHRSAQDDRRVHFGLGSNSTYSEIEIRWPSGTLQRIGPGNANNHLLITEMSDYDGDTVEDGVDNCFTVANLDQADGDADDVGDACDNCQIADNPSQCDTNNDGYGNHCDADFDGDLFVDFLDVAVVKLAFLSSLGDPAYDENVDLNCDSTLR